MAIDRMEEAGRVAYEETNDTILALIRLQVMNSPLLRAILEASLLSNWSSERLALVMAYTFILKDQENMERMLDMVNKSTRPILMTMHCKTCTCTNKGVDYEDV